MNIQTDGDVAGAMCLEELIEVLPDARYPLDDTVARRCPPASISRSVLPSTHLGVSEAPSQIAGEEAVNGLHVIGTQHPAEVVMQLKVCRRTGRRRLVHRSDYVRTADTHTHTHTARTVTSSYHSLLITCTHGRPT